MSEPITNEQLEQALRFPESDFRRRIATELLAARRRIKELEADRERLDWLEKSNEYAFWSHGKAFVTMSAEEGKRDFRSAIDAARKDSDEAK